MARRRDQTPVAKAKTLNETRAWVTSHIKKKFAVPRDSISMDDPLTAWGHSTDGDLGALAAHFNKASKARSRWGGAHITPRELASKAQNATVGQLSSIFADKISDANGGDIATAIPTSQASDAVEEWVLEYFEEYFDAPVTQKDRLEEDLRYDLSQDNLVDFKKKFNASSHLWNGIQTTESEANMVMAGATVGRVQSYYGRKVGEH